MNDDTSTPTPYQAPFQEPQLQPQQPKKSKAGKVILMTLLALVLIGAAVAAGWYVGNMSKSQAVDDAKKTAREAALKEVADKNAKEPEPQSSSQAKTTKETTCNADELSLAMKDSSESGAGTLAYDLVFTNTSQRTCTLGGFPGVSLVNENGNMIGSPADRAKNYEEKKLTLAPGKEVKATLSVANSANLEAGKCKEGAVKLRVYPPNDTGYLSVASSPITSWCPEFLTSPVLSM